MAEQCCTPTFFSFLMYSSHGDSRADYSICCIVRPLKVMTSRQKDHPNYASGPLMVPSCGLLRLSLTLITSVLGVGGVLQRHHHRCYRWCVAAGEIRNRPVWMVGFTGSILWWAAAKELLKRALCEETHISNQTPALSTLSSRQPWKYLQLISLSVYATQIRISPIRPTPPTSPYICWRSCWNQMH